MNKTYSRIPLHILHHPLNWLRGLLSFSHVAVCAVACKEEADASSSSGCSPLALILEPSRQDPEKYMRHLSGPASRCQGVPNSNFQVLAVYSAACHHHAYILSEAASRSLPGVHGGLPSHHVSILPRPRGFCRMCRDLAQQVHDVISDMRKHLAAPSIRNALIVGGTDLRESKQQRQGGVHIVTGTPGTGLPHQPSLRVPALTCSLCSQWRKESRGSPTALFLVSFASRSSLEELHAQ